jgi:hypothetical protein
VPRQNRVTPFGDILATPERGTFMGNRGVLHDAEGHIRRAWQLKRWIVCVLEFRGRKRQVMTPGHYTELFFLDEATALAAGHAPVRNAATPGSLPSATPGERRIQRTEHRRGPPQTRSTADCMSSGWLPTAPDALSWRGWTSCRMGYS